MAKAKSTEDQVKDPFKDTLKAMEAKYGANTVIHGNTITEDLEVVSSGSLTLDNATGINGIPIGKLIECYGFESCGKSTLMYHTIANFQKVDGEVILIDYEQSFDKKYAKALGIDVSRLIVINPNCMEEAYNIAEEFIKTGKVRLVCLDSHTAMMPLKIMQGEVGDVTIGLQARINSQALGKIKPLLKHNRCTLWANSQLRVAVGNYGDPNVPTGGLAYRFYTDMRFKVSKSLDRENELNKTTVEVVKNKCACPNAKAQFNINWGTGVDRQMEIIDLACEYKLITKAGGWYTVGENKYQIGKLRELLNDNVEYSTQLEIDIIAKLKGE